MEHQGVNTEVFDVLGSGQGERNDAHPLGPFVGLFWGAGLSVLLWIALVFGAMALVHGR